MVLKEEAVSVRPAAEKDFAAVTRIQQRTPEAAQWPLGDYSGCALLIAFVEGKPAGFCAWRQTLPDEAELLNLAVDPDYRRRGVGNSLIEALLRAASGGIYLEVAENNRRAIALYRKHGWGEAGIRKGYYEQGKINAVVMKKTS